MAGALGASAAFRPGTRAARVFLERNPYVAWEAQRQAFAHPAFTGVVHPHLPHWESPADDGTPRDDATDAADTHRPPEPTSASRSWLPRVARLGPMEARALPSTHVQTVSASWCRDLDDARQFMRVAADAGATALLCVTGDVSRHAHDLDALALLRAARALRDAGEIDSDVRLACAANPCLEASSPRGASDGSQTKKSASARLEEKLEAGAETVITQPSVVPELARSWRREIQASGLAHEVEHIAGIAIPTSRRAAERWMRLVFGESYMYATFSERRVAGDDFYDEDTVANHREFSVRLACPARASGVHCQHTAVNLCNDAGVPTDDGRACSCDEGRVGARCDACAEGWSATYVVDGGEIGAGEFGNNAGKLVSCDAPDGDASRGAGNKDAPTLVPWAEWALIAGSCVTTALATVLYVMVTRELRGTPVFSPAARAISPTAADAPNLRDSSGDGSRNASGNPPPDGEIPFDDAFGGSLPPMVGRGYANLRDEESGR